MNFTIITLFPELIEIWSKTGLIGSAIKKSLIGVRTINPREYATDNHKSVDDTAFGGSDGMVMKFEPLSKAIEAAGPSHVAFLSPQARPWTQEKAWEWQRHENVTLVCGRYAGFDHRLIEEYADEEVSIGDYILNGGELAAMVVAESVSRLIPGVLGNGVSAHRESFSEGLLEAPAFTRPREIAGMSVPAPLLSGHHAEIERFERDVSIIRTRQIRPEWVGGSELIAEFESALTRLEKLNETELSAIGLSREELHRMKRELE